MDSIKQVLGDNHWNTQTSLKTTEKKTLKLSKDHYLIKVFPLFVILSQNKWSILKNKAACEAHDSKIPQWWVRHRAETDTAENLAANTNTVRGLSGCIHYDHRSYKWREKVRWFPKEVRNIYDKRSVEFAFHNKLEL